MHAVEGCYSAKIKSVKVYTIEIYPLYGYLGYLHYSTSSYRINFLDPFKCEP